MRHFQEAKENICLQQFCTATTPGPPLVTDRCRPDLLLEWVPLLCSELVARSLEFPLVSGFYRLVTLVFRETARAGYFNPPRSHQNTPNANNELLLSPASPGPVMDALGLGSGTEEGGGDGGVEGNGGTEGAGGGGEHREQRDGGKLVCRRVLRRWAGRFDATDVSSRGRKSVRVLPRAFAYHSEDAIKVDRMSRNDLGTSQFNVAACTNMYEAGCFCKRASERRHDSSA